jgi:putative addiction module component (TIGR02574 family)
MSDVDVAKRLKLPAEEKLRLLELLWESLATGASALPLSNVHSAAIDEALDEHRQAPDDVLTLEQVLSGVERRDGPAGPRAT